MRNFNFAIAIGKLLIYAVGLLHIGHGTTWPGELSLWLDKGVISELINRNPQLKIVLVTGTNGKTTTTKLITHLATKKGYAVVSNLSGANLVNGIASALINQANYRGQIADDSLILEVDENALTQLLDEIVPDAIVVLNLFRDQLDRYGEVNAISSRWANAFTKLASKTTLLLNGNDPEVFNLGKMPTQASVKYFGLEKKLMTARRPGADADQVICPKCSSHLSFQRVAYSHIGYFRCNNCGLSNNDILTLPPAVQSPLLGIFNQFNLAAAVLTVKEIWDIDASEINGLLVGFRPSFGRQEQLVFQKKKILIQLSKNPAGFNQALSVLKQLSGPKNIVIVLNDRIPDGRDISWIWDVDFQLIADDVDKIFVAGDRALDMGLCLKYSFGKNIEFKNQDQFWRGDNITISESLPELLKLALKETDPNEQLIIFPTYSAMLEVRQLITGQLW